ncbi:hypothetical protein ACI2L1_11815 [Streptomyces sp. NPDC019531]|uniref:hypothetical protein n=1 Tax=Streptomyces sp. NPDC019531 TaxID=3365062 RepID=UPI003850BA4F
MIVTQVGSAAAEFDLTPHWNVRQLGREGWGQASALTRELVDCFVSTVGQALGQAGCHLVAEESEFITATWYGTCHVGELMHEQLREAGPRWLDPEQFLYYSPHSLLSAAALALGVGGAGSTLLGPDAELQALAHAVRRIRSGRVASVVVAEYEALTPFAAFARSDGPGLPDDGALPTGRAAALVLTAGQEGEDAPAITVRRGIDDAGAQRLAEQHGAPVVQAGPGLLRTLTEARTPLVVLSGDPGRRDAVVLS